MSDSPGWTSPGSPSPDDDPRDGRPTEQQPQQAPSHPPQQPQQPQGWSRQPQGWGAAPQPGGWGGWHPAALVPKPGVIPLRPLGLGEILDGAVSTARAHWRTVLAVSLGIAVITQLISVIAIRVWLGDSSGLAALENNPEPTEEELRSAFGDMAAFGSVTGLVMLLGTVLSTAMLTIVVSRAVLGHGVTVGEAWRDSRSRLLRLLGLVLLIPLIAVAAFAGPLLLGGLTGESGVTVLGGLGGFVLMLWLWIRFSLSAPALMLERQGLFTAMRRSWRLVRGSWWRVFGIQVLTLILVLLVAYIIEIPASVVAALVEGGDVGSIVEGSVSDFTWTYLVITGIGAVVSSTITLPVSAGVTALLYIDLRIRREALDLELARAAGVDETSSPGH